MADPRVSKLARLLVNYCVATRPGDKIILAGTSSALPLVTETYRAILQAGGHPFLLWRDQEFTEILLQQANDQQLAFIPDPLQALYDSYDALINLGAVNNTRALSNVDPAQHRKAEQERRALQRTVMNRTAAGAFRWVTTLYPTHALAQEADMSLAEYEDFVYRACHVDLDDPEAAWRSLSGRQQTLVDWLAGKRQVVVRGPHVDLTLSIAGRTFVNSDGHKNMPSGEIFTGPVETSVNGWIRFTYPAIYAGREVDGVELQFEAGKVVSASASKNEAFLQQVLDTDPGARYLGEFAIGTNDGINQFTKSILYDEKIGGTIHLAVGAGYPETGSHNESAVHWDMICDMRQGGQIWVDGELFYDSGRFLLLD